MSNSTVTVSEIVEALIELHEYHDNASEVGDAKACLRALNRIGEWEKLHKRYAEAGALSRAMLARWGDYEAMSGFDPLVAKIYEYFQENTHPATIRKIDNEGRYAIPSTDMLTCEIASLDKCTCKHYRYSRSGIGIRNGACWHIQVVRAIWHIHAKRLGDKLMREALQQTGGQDDTTAI